MSTLQQQLKKIGTADLRNVSEVSRKFKASFLFTAREAADQDLDTIYSIAYNGIMELTILDSKFAAYESTLFSEEMKSVDRILQSEEENAKLNASIKSFLQNLSPYFLLKPAGKVLEYLIRRFRINEFNVEDILICIFPYHETKAFVKMVTILNIEQNSPWTFLTPIQKTGIPLERSLLVARMARKRNILNFVTDLVIKSPVHFPTLYSFYAATMIELVSERVINEDSVMVITGNLIDGMNTSDVPELQIASYMILSQLATKVSMTKEAVHALTDAAIKHYNKSYFNYCLLTVVHLAQSQTSCVRLGKSATKRLLKASAFDKTLLEIAEKYAIDRFFTVIVGALCDASKVDLLVEIVLQGLISSDNIRLLCENTIEGYLNLVESGCTEETKESYTKQFQPLLATVSQRYVDELDTVLEAKLNSYANKSDEKSKILYEFASIAFKGTRHEVIEEANTTLYLCLNSPAVTTRLLALKKLVDVMDNESSPLTQSPEVFQSAFTGCLNSIDETLVYAVRDVPEQLLKSVSSEVIISSISSLLRDNNVLARKEVVTIFKFLLGPFVAKYPNKTAKVAQLLATFIFAAPTDQVKLLEKESTASTKDAVLKSMLSSMKSASKKPASLSTLFVKLEADVIKSEKDDHSLLFWIQGIQSQNVSTRTLALLVLNRAVFVSADERQYKVASKCLSAITESLTEEQCHDLYTVKLASASAIISSEGLPVESFVEQLKKNSVTSILQINLVQSTLDNITVSLKHATQVSWFSEKKPQATESYCHTVTELFKVFANGATLGSFEEMITKLVSIQLKDNVLSFLMNVWSYNDNAFLVKARALQIAATYISQVAPKNTIDFQHVLPVLLPCLTQEYLAIRINALRCLESIQSTYKSIGLPTGKKVYSSDDSADANTKATGKAVVESAKSLYDITVSFPDLRTNDAAHFVDYLSYRKEEIKQDQKYTILMLKDYVRICDESKEKQQKVRKNHIIDFLLNHVMHAPLADIQINILSVLNEVETPRKLQQLYPLLETVLDSPRTTKSTTLVALLIHCYSPLNAADFGSKNDKTLALFLRLLSNRDALEGEDEDGWQASTRRFALKQISSEFFAKANEKAQKSILSLLMDIATNGQQSDVRAAKTVLAEIPIAAKMLEEMLFVVAKSISSSTSETETSTLTTKRARTAEKPAEKKSVDLYELVTVLELIESKTIENDVALIKPLFEVLTAMVNADLRDSPVSLEYINQIIMSSLTRIIQSAEEKKVHVDESTLRVDVVVQCIRVTGNPQTHNQALLLMATIASMYPECVLHNIMPVFTFMGANVLRQDDNYSFQVIQQTLEKIIPPLVASSRLSSNNEAALALQVKPIIKVFVDAMFHIPKHRRLRLFSVLIQTLGEDEFLYAIISLLLEKFTEKLAKGARTEADSLTEFSLTISQQFSPQTQMKAVLSLLNGLLVLPNDKSEDEVMNQDTLFNTNEHNAKQLRQYKLATLNFVGQLLGSRSFLGKLMAQANLSEEFEKEMQPYYLTAVEYILKIVTYFTGFRDGYAVSQNANPSITKFWRGMLKVVYDDLAKVNALLPLPAFVDVVSHLIKHSEVSIRRKAMDMFNEKLQVFNQITEEDEVLLVGMVKQFTDVIEKESALSGEEDCLVNKQSALLCISSLASLFGAIFPEQFSEAIPVVIGKDCLLLSKPQVKISSLVCLTVICQEIGPRAMPHLPKFMPIVIDILSMTVEAERPNAMLQLSVISALETIVKVLPHFISPYLSKILANLLHPSIYTSDETNATQKLLAKEKVMSVLVEIATNVPARTLFGPVFTSYPLAVKNGKESVLALLKLASEAIRAVSRDAMTAHYKQLFKFFLTAFDIRRIHNDIFDDEAINEIESAVISAFLDLVMKLNETLFKPLFLKVVDWATVELAVDGSTESVDAKKRVLFFYKLLDSLLDKLKSIFTPYFGYVIDDVIDRLDAYRSEEKQEEPDTLWNFIMSALHKSFLYDNDNLWNAEKFEKILDPVVDQMLVTAKGDAPDYLTRMTTYLVPLVGQMAVTVSNDTLWKPLNHKILMKTREDIPEIRLAALRCIEEFYSRLGEEWLLFLAESISFLAELMEDDDVRVEKLVQLVNAQIETHLGESLDKFFN
ncbi:hypothetical protein J3Q64DRAFT_1850250 [Phycomyces blakesleeanus]|uniref:U3 small nucleolar RNA-associated protein 10 n=2 Tax=Phycomyces blakesleeanus TaxID=4837 RepID=A0A167PRH3_PHYB8|nr:hypothetical protein PHYBLDRAFT_179550 [Phycomyces blakesleeanus NRRL 1555(-)]OAD78407.1 hypothetical protein PHYBLDRAFT_179550 [Phycomyces blakesleeanus NRRL 1555(-)]|eukprot:XP_018296447.1 hypothetical protein PHYBLDRAFT_179550 [Phycomyces blakesleeanus NRRL 1555(-)]